jgi:pimeloyl-ACP methyl ester carboxylesterase
MPQGALKVIRPVVAAASILSPRLAGAVAFRAFCRPPAGGGRGEVLQRAVDRAEARMAGAERIEVDHSGGTVLAYRFPAPGGGTGRRVLLVHGWTSRAAFMSAFVEPLTARGFDVVAVDLPGHGRSSGRTLHLPLGISALRAVSERFGPWHAVIGHSFGGALATFLASGALADPVPIGRLVLIGTPHSMQAVFRAFGSTVGLSRRGQRWFEANVPRLTGRSLSSFEAPAHLARIGTPTLVLHAPDDKEVPFASAEALGAAGPHVRIEALPGLGHRRILGSAATVAAAAAFIAGH